MRESQKCYTAVKNVLYPVRWGVSPWKEYEKYATFSEQLVCLSTPDGYRNADHVAWAFRQDGGVLMDNDAYDLIASKQFQINTYEYWLRPVLVQFDERLARTVKVRDIANGLGIQLCPPEFAPQVCLQHIEFPRGSRILVGMDPIAPAGDGGCQDCYFEIRVDLVGGMYLSTTNGDAGIGCTFTHVLLCQE